MATMKLIIDNRETGLYQKIKDKQSVASAKGVDIVCEYKPIPLGDIIIGTEESPIVIIERKTFADLFASITDGRYDEQSFRLKNASGVACHNIIYLLEGIATSLDDKKRKLLYSCITSIQLFKGFSVIRSSSLDETACIILAMYDKIGRDLQKGKMLFYNVPSPLATTTMDTTTTDTIISPPHHAKEEQKEEQKDESYLSVGITKTKGANITRENIGAILLSQIPSINYITAEAIMAGYSGGFREFYMKCIETDGAVLDGLKNEKGRKISKTAIANIKRFIM